MPSSAHDPAGERREPGTRRRPDPDATGPRWAHPGAEGVAVPPAAAPAELATSHLPPALRTMTGRHWLVPVLAGLGGYAATVLSTVVALAVALLGLAVSGDSSTDSAAGGLPPELDSAADSGGPWTVIGVPFQLAAMAVLSPLRVLIDLGGEALAMSAVLPQYFALTCGVATAWLLTRGLGARLRIEHRGVQWTMAVLAGLTWAVVALAVTALTAVRADVPVFFTTLRVVVTGAGATLVVVSLLVGALTVAAALNGRVTQPAPGRLVTSIERAAPGLLRAARPVAVHAVAFGVLAAVFQTSAGTQVMGVTNTGAVRDWVPMFLFSVLVGLSMDYHVFVLSRIRENVEKGLPSREAIAAGVGRTGPVVTSAAVVMVGVFSIFATLGLAEMKQIGLGLAVAIAVDATLIRLLLLPALLSLGGRRFWPARSGYTRLTPNDAPGQ